MHLVTTGKFTGRTFYLLNWQFTFLDFTIKHVQVHFEDAQKRNVLSQTIGMVKYGFDRALFGEYDSSYPFFNKQLLHFVETSPRSLQVYRESRDSDWFILNRRNFSRNNYKPKKTQKLFRNFNLSFTIIFRWRLH